MDSLEPGNPLAVFLAAEANTMALGSTKETMAAMKKAAAVRGGWEQYARVDKVGGHGAREV